MALIEPLPNLLDSLECELLRVANSNVTTRAEPSNRPEGVKVSLGVFWFVVASSSLFFLIFVGVKYLHPDRQHLYRLQERRTLHIFLSHLGAIFISLTGSYFQANELRYGLPCWLFLVVNYISVPMLIFPTVTRLVQLYRKNQWTENVLETVEQDGLAVDDTDATTSVGGGSETVRSFVSTAACAKIGIYLRVLFFAENLEEWRLKKTAKSQTAASSTLAQQKRKGQASRKVRSRLLRLLKSDFGASLVLFAIFFPYLLTAIIVTATSPFVHKGCYGCAPTPLLINISVAESIIALFMIAFAYVLALKSVDPYGFVQEARLFVWCGGIWAVLCFILSSVFRPRMRYSDFQFLMLVELFIVVAVFMQSGLQVILALREHANVHAEQAKEESQFTFEEFEEQFLSKTGPYYAPFAKHLESEFSYESLAFLESVQAWESAYYDLGPKTSRTRAKRIANMFIGERAELPCNLSAPISNEILRVLEVKAEVPGNLFEKACKEIKYMLYRDGFRRFLKSKVFRQQLDQQHQHGKVVAVGTMVSTASSPTV